MSTHQHPQLSSVKLSASILVGSQAHRKRKLSMTPACTQVPWKDEENVPVAPKLIGTRVFENYPLKDVVDYIDWNPFFQVLLPQLTGRLRAGQCSAAGTHS